MKNYLVNNMELDDFQMQLLKTNSNALVIAGAGSGKTLTIIGKVNYLVENKFCHPNKILIISFTNASTHDIEKKMKYSCEIITFHKLAIKVLDKLNISYNIVSDRMLNYIIQEKLIRADFMTQKTILNYLNITTSYSMWLNSKSFQSFCNLIASFINIYKTNQLKKEDILKCKYSKTERKILLIVFKIYKEYLDEKGSVNGYDFDDLIIMATKNINNSGLNYDYIIIDEFQDTSLIRLNLIKEIVKLSNAKIIVVGDDWQSIYRFSGCDLNIFLNFQKFFPETKIIKLTNTYRNSIQLIRIASSFIAKNPLQIPKNMVSSKSNNSPIVFVPYSNRILAFKKLLKTVINLNGTIMILVRNNKDIFKYIDKDFNVDDQYIYYNNSKISYYTIHKSKGLESDYTIVLNCNNEILGFPNKIEDNPIIEKLLPNNEIKYAEERRLFYVALTRCKEKTYLLYDKKNPSIFIKEIKKITKKSIHQVEYFKD